MAHFGKKNVVIIGGNAAGMTAASRLRRLDSEAEITVLEQGRYISYSICGAPYYLEGLVPKMEDLLALTPATARSERDIRVRTEWECVEISAGRRDVEARDRRTGLTERLPFDNLVLATGYEPVTAGIAGADHPAVFKIGNLENVIALKQFLETDRPCTAIVVGAGYIGLNLAEALNRRGLSVKILEREDQIFRAVDRDIAALVEKECRDNGVEISVLTPVTRVLFDGDRPSGVAMEGTTYTADLIAVDVGLRPNIELAERAGLRIGPSGAIAVTAQMETSHDGIYAAGNCAETIHRITGRPVTSALGTHAVKQGRVAGENIAGMRSRFPGVLQTSVTKFFTLSVARTGLNEWEARRFGFDYAAVSVKSPAHARYFPPQETVVVKLVVDRRTEKLLGAQIAGSPWTAKRIDVAALAITAGMTLEEVAQSDLAYSPPHSPLWDPLQVAANVALRQLRG